MTSYNYIKNYHVKFDKRIKSLKADMEQRVHNHPGTKYNNRKLEYI